VREVEEETGIIARARMPLGSVTFSAGGEQVTATYYLMEFVRSEPAKKARDLAWCTFEEALARASFAEAREMIELARRVAAT
jgi:8-oxo-dGTP pyrophosphatase MutT (NUDIX family)